jgi:hypothetical protein
MARLRTREPARRPDAAGTVRLKGDRRGKAGKPADWTTNRLSHAAVGLEAEFTLLLDGAPARPEAVFGDPRGFIHQRLMHRVGTSYHLPNSAAIYFDTGVIEVATPAIEIERGCMTRAVRSLWEAIHFVRDHLDVWERDTGRHAQLQGFSAHYNVSVGDRAVRAATAPRLERLAHALTYVLPAPVMLLATNRRSTGVGVRPRHRRIEVTVDFTPDPALMIATGALIAGVVREMGSWPSIAQARLERSLHVMRRFAPMRHTSRRGWLARFDCYPQNPFACDVDAPIWPTSGGALGLRDVARRVFRRFLRPIARVADPLTLRLIALTLARGGATQLSLPDRPPEYDDVGRLAVWKEKNSIGRLARSRYERVLMNAVAGRPLRFSGRMCTPIRVRGWSRIVFRRDADGARFTVPLDALVDRLGEWEER